MVRRHLLTIVAIGGFLVVGCGSTASSSNGESLPPSAVSPEASRLSAPDCGGDDGACQGGLVLDGAFYGFACSGVRAEFITGETLASGEVDGRSISVREIVGIDPGLMIAVDVSANECFRDRDDEGDSGWSIAFVDGADIEELRDALCEVGEGRTALRDCNDGRTDD